MAVVVNRQSIMSISAFREKINTQMQVNCANAAAQPAVFPYHRLAQNPVKTASSNAEIAAGTRTTHSLNSPKIVADVESTQ